METFQFIVKIVNLFLITGLLIYCGIRIEALKDELSKYKKGEFVAEKVIEQPKEKVYKLKYRFEWDDCVGVGTIWEPLEETTKTLSN